MCLQCQPKKELKKTTLKQTKTTIKKQTPQNKAYRKSQSTIRDVFFEHHIALCTHSEEDGQAINSPTRANICHIFYKRTYKSVQGNLNNFVYLTLDQHTRFDQLLDRNDFDSLEKEFKCWKLVLKRVRELLPFVGENGKLKTLFEEYLTKN